MLAALLLLQAPVDLSADARLSKPLAFEARIEPLPETLARLGKAAGVALTVERRMAPLKASIFVAARPVRRTMADLASVFDAEWRPVPGGYEFGMSVPRRNALEGYLARERESERAAAEREVRGAAVVARYQWTDLPGLRDAAMRELGAFARNTDPGFAEAHARYSLFDGAVRNGRTYLLGSLALGMSERDLAALWDGRSFYASTQASGGIPMLPPGAASISGLEARREDAEGRTVESTTPVRFFLRYDQGARDLAWALNAGASGGSSRNHPGTGWGGEDAALREHPYRKSLEAWATDLSEEAKTKPPELERALGKVEMAKPVWESLWATEADTLETLHSQSGLDVVAEAFRRAGQRGFVPFAEPTVGAALREWGFRGDARLESGAILYRPHAFWNRRADEPPEGAMRRWEARPDRGLDAMAELVAATTPNQARMLRTMASRKRLERVGEGIPALRLWGTLTRRARERLLAGGEIGFGALSPAARAAAEAAVLDGIFEGGTPSGAMLALFDGPWDPSRLGSLAVRATTEGVETGSWWLDAPEGIAREAAQLPAGPGVRLEIGPAGLSGRGEGMSFTLPR